MVSFCCCPTERRSEWKEIQEGGRLNQDYLSKEMDVSQIFFLHRDASLRLQLAAAVPFCPYACFLLQYLPSNMWQTNFSFEEFCISVSVCPLDDQKELFVIYFIRGSHFLHQDFILLCLVWIC